MTYSGAGHVDILSRASGKSLAQLSASSSQNFSLTQPSVISLQGTPSLVASYQQQGQDLILHMRDGSPVRYQHFFTVMDGEQSELVFREGEQPLQQARFTSGWQNDPQATVALTPGFESLNNIDALLPSASTSAAEASNPVTAAGLGVPGLIGAGASVAAANGDSGNVSSGQNAPANSVASSDAAALSSETETVTAAVSDSTAATDVSANNDLTTTDASAGSTAEASAAAATATPKPTITTPFVDYWLNVEERSHDEMLSGTTGIAGSGQSVAVRIGNTTYQATVTEEGNWALLLTPAMMTASNFADGRHWAHITVTNAEGETGTTCATFVTDSVMPHVTLSELADGNRINASDITSPLVLSGTGDSGDIVTLTLGTATWQITVAANGTWQASMSAAEVQAMAPGDYTLAATSASRSGNASSTSLDVNVYTSDALPTLAINIVGTDDAINISEGVYGMEVTGTSTHLASGNRVELALDGQSYSGYVNGNTWSVQIDDNALKAVADGYYTFTVSATDADGNSASATRDIWLLTHPRTSNPTVSANEITAADAVYHDSVLYYTVSGTMAATFPLALVALKSDIMQTYYTATVAEEGSWTVDIPANELQNGFNTLTFGVRDVAENWEEQQVSFVTTLGTASLTPLEGNEAVSAATLAEDNPTDGATATGTDQNPADNSVATATESNDSVTDNGLAEKSLIGENISGSITGTADDDTFRLSSLNFSHLDGGTGHDTLILSGSHLSLDFAALDLKIGSIETIDLGTAGTNSLTLGKTDLLQLANNGSEALTIKGMDGNTVVLSTTEGGVWSDAGQRTIDGQLYDFYHNSSASHEGTLADLLIQHNLQVQMA